MCKVSKILIIILYEELCSRGTQLSTYWGWKMTKFTLWKKKKNDLTIISKSHAHYHTMKKTHAKFQSLQNCKRSCAHKRYQLFIYKRWKWLSSQCAKVTKNDLTIISKPYAHHHTMKNKCKYAMFQNDQYKTVRGVALTRSTHCLYIEGEKWLSSQCGKSDKNCLATITKTTCTSTYHDENTCKVSKQSV